MEPHIAVAQIIGYIGVAGSLLLYVGKTRGQTLLYKFLLDALWFVNLLLIGGYTGAVLNFICMGRELVFYQRGRKAWASHRVWLFVFLALTLLSPTFEWIKLGALTWPPVLPAIGSLIAVVSFYSERTSAMRLLGFLAQIFWLIYGIILDNKSSIVCGVLTLLSALIGLLREWIAKHRGAKHLSQ